MITSDSAQSPSLCVYPSLQEATVVQLTSGIIGGLMTADAIKTVGVLGAGTMGNGIAHVFARAGYHVILRDVEKRFLDRGVETISKNLDREVKKGKISEADKPVIVARIPSNSLAKPKSATLTWLWTKNKFCGLTSRCWI